MKVRDLQKKKGTEYKPNVRNILDKIKERWGNRIKKKNEKE